MTLVTEAQELIGEINSIRSMSDLRKCQFSRDVLDRKIRSSHNINALEETLKVISEELAKHTFNVPTGLMVGAGLGAVGGYLANFSLFGIASSGVAGAVVGGLTTINEEKKQQGAESSIKKGGAFLLNLLNQSLQQRIKFLYKQEEIAREQQEHDGLGLRRRH